MTRSVYSFERDPSCTDRLDFTYTKIRFNPDLLELIPAEQLDADFGGNFEYEFDPESYWSQMVSYVKHFALVNYIQGL